MVSSDTGLPEPDNPENELTVSNEGIILITDDEMDSDDQETIILDDYQPLSTEETADSNLGSSEDEVQETEATSASPSVPPITPIEQTLVKEVWSAPTPKDIEMDSQRVDEVKQAMLNVTLPPSSIPEWAANIPEEEWKQQLIDRLLGLRTDVN